MNTAVKSSELPLGEDERAKPSKRQRRTAESTERTNVAAVEVLPAERPIGTAVAVVDTPTPTQVLLTLLQDRDTDPERIAQMMSLQERWEKNEAKKAYDEAFTAFKANPPTIIKNKQVSFGEGNKKTEYKHAELDQVTEKISVALSQHGLSHAWKTEQLDGGAIKVTCTLKHVKGHSESVWLQSGRDDSGGKNNIQGLASTVTYLERYTLLAITGLAAKGQDDDGNGGASGNGDKISDAQKAEIVGLIANTSSDTKAFCALYGVETVDALPAAKFNHARALLTKKKGQQRQQGGAQ